MTIQTQIPGYIIEKLNEVEKALRRTRPSIHAPPPFPPSFYNPHDEGDPPTPEWQPVVIYDINEVVGK
jgi:hypothetical protein